MVIEKGGGLTNGQVTTALSPMFDLDLIGRLTPQQHQHHNLILLQMREVLLSIELQLARWPCRERQMATMQQDDKSIILARDQQTS